jgi:hypothetical protein
MEGGTKALRQRWKERTDAAFERMFAGKSEEELRTLSQRETMAELSGRELAIFLLEEHVATDATARPPDGLVACCPKCNQAGKRAAEPEKVPARTVRTRVGDIHLQRQRWRCAKCRSIEPTQVARLAAEIKRRGRSRCGRARRERPPEEVVGLPPEAEAAAQLPPPSAAAKEHLADARANGGGDDGEQRHVWLAGGGGEAGTWQRYERWLRLAWSGKAGELLT